MVHVVLKIPIIQYHKIRSFKNFDENKFINDMKSTPWDIVKKKNIFDDVKDIVETWSCLFSDIVDKHLPLRKHRVKRKHQPKWLNADIIEAFKTRDRFKSLNKSRTIQNVEK